MGDFGDWFGDLYGNVSQGLGNFSNWVGGLFGGGQGGQGDSTQSWINSLTGDNTSPFNAWQTAKSFRDTGNIDLGLANAEHALFSQSLFKPGGFSWPINPLMQMAVPALYSGVKGLAQNTPMGGAMNAVGQSFGMPLTTDQGASPASWDQLYWGLAPFWRQLQQ